jgi:hypothetical protein
MEHKDFRTILNDLMEQKNLTAKRLAELTNIPERFIEALQKMDIKNLPAIPYVRGYLKKLSEILHLNYEELRALYEKELIHRASGASDKLPANRFAIQSFKKKGVIISVVILTLLLYILINVPSFFGLPPLEVSYPNSPTTIVTNPVIVLEGKFNPKDKLTINNKEQLGDANGQFRVTFNLQPGLNTVEFKVKRFLGRETQIIRQILYQPSY